MATNLQMAFEVSCRQYAAATASDNVSDCTVVRKLIGVGALCSLHRVATLP